MAESSKKKLVPEVPENADFILFAEDLVNYLINKNYPLYIFEIDKIPFRDWIRSPFDKIVQSAVAFLDNCSEMNNDDIFSQIHENAVVSSTTYIQFADSLALRYFAEGFKAESFLKFCVRVSKMAALYYKCEIENAPTLAKLHIVNILKRHHMTVDGWNNLQKIAREVGNMSRNFKRKHEPLADEENDSLCINYSKLKQFS